MTILDAINDPNLFADWFKGSTWNRWRTFLKALFALTLTEDEFAIYTKHTQRTIAPENAFREAWVIVGRRGGKSLVAAVVAVYCACFKDYSPFLKPGELAVIAILAADRKQAQIILRYIRGFLQLPILRKLVLNDVQESIELKGGVLIEVQTASFRTTRGRTYALVLLDEAAYFRSEESANPDTEIVKAVRPGLATIPGAMLLVISSPYARKGALWSAYSKHFGKDSKVLVWQGATLEMNPSVDPAVIEEALEEDEPAARAEYFAEFRKDIEAYLSREVLDTCTIAGRQELPPVAGVKYFAFTDPAGGSGADSFTLAIAHAEKDKSILDAVREIKPPFSPEATTLELCGFLKSYRITAVTGDRYAGEWPREQFRKNGITYNLSEKNKSEIYRDSLPQFNSGRVELLDIPRLTSQLLNLERRTGWGGRDSIDHGPGAHDDAANSVCGVLHLVGGKAKKLFWLWSGDAQSEPITNFPTPSTSESQTAPTPEAPKSTERQSQFYTMEIDKL